MKNTACIAVAGICFALSAHGSVNVFDDAVFWFRGGKDIYDIKGAILSDGKMQQGEFFDDLHANDTNHVNHKAPMVSYTGKTRIGGKDYSHSVFAENGAFATEQVVFPALGTDIVDNVQVLHISNDGKKIGSTNYYFPFVVKPHAVFASNNISNEYTIISRIKLNDDGYNHNQCFLRLGYNETTTNGMWLGFTKPSSSWYSGCYRIAAYRAPNSGAKVSSVHFNLAVPTNTWVDLAIVVGDGKLRVGVAAPVSLSSHNNNPTIAFDETGMWTDNCPLLSEGNYRMFCFNGQTEPKTDANADNTYFVGSVQQIAIWKRALNNQEVMAAFGMPRPAIFRTGFDNGNSNEFGGTRSGATQTIDGLGSWQNVYNKMQSGDEWTVNFDALRDETGLPQIFSIKSQTNSVAALIEPVILDGETERSLGKRLVTANARVFWPVPEGCLKAGANTLLVKRIDNGAGDFLVDAMELGGSLGVGTGAATPYDGRVAPELNPTGIPSAADPNLQHWSQGIRAKKSATNLHFRVWVDSDVVGVGASKLRMLVGCVAESKDIELKDEKFSLLVNGFEEAERGSDTNWLQTVVNFEAGKLLPGWNDIELKTGPTVTNCYWPVAYYRFETVLPRPFSIPPPGSCIIMR